jgi:hypothetical protein
MTRPTPAFPKQAPAWLELIENPSGFDPSWPPEFGVYFERKFECVCGEVWVDLHDSDCNDRCSSCNREIEPSETRKRDALTGVYL